MSEYAKDRIHRYLDGELSRADLTAEELRRLETYEDAIGATASLAREAAPDVTEAVMARVRTPRAGAAQRLLGLLDWLWQPRPVAIRPAWVGAFGILVALGGGLLATGLATGPAQPNGLAVADSQQGPDAVGEVLVQFRLDEPDASSVRLSGTFTGWEAKYELHETSSGVWTAVVPLEPGVHEYAFVVDGEEWRPDPTAPAVEDGFGGKNSRVAVLLPDANDAS